MKASFHNKNNSKCLVILDSHESNEENKATIELLEYEKKVPVTCIQWTDVGKEETDGKEQFLAKLFLNIHWQDLTPGKEIAMSPGMAINASIKELNIPKPSHYALSPILAPYDLIAIRGHYSSGTANIFILDIGTQLTVLAIEFITN